MLAKVGSAGHVLESVIQYPQGTGRTEKKSESSEKKEKLNEGKKPKLSNAPERVVAASEITEKNAKVGTAEEGASKKATQLEREAFAVQEGAVINENDLIKQNLKALDLSQEAVKITVEDVNKKLAPTGSKVEFSYHEKTGRYSFKILDNEGKILKEVPPEKSLDMVAKMFEMVGILVDEKL